ncbi:hypothetical protein [Maribacter antarcticus]|uniref:hypothetical protein n=1 Tax=Maribacter antarcticus TaxID=505250 RepID=UPI00047BBC29|nr:hypothetical protein [Maribacter antarcticus]
MKNIPNRNRQEAQQKNATARGRFFGVLVGKAIQYPKVILPHHMHKRIGSWLVKKQERKVCKKWDSQSAEFPHRLERPPIVVVKFSKVVLLRFIWWVLG